MEKGTTITDAINAGDFSLAVSRAGVLMPGNQAIIDKLTACQAASTALAGAVSVALDTADGN